MRTLRWIIGAVVLCGALLVMPGCATIGLGVVAGVASFGGKKAAEAEWKWYQRERRCHKLKTEIYRQRCMNALRARQGTL